MTNFSGFPVAINGMITVPMTSQMYQTMVANIQQLQPSSDGTLCITPMQVQNIQVTSNNRSSSTVCTSSNSNSNNTYNTTYTLMTPATFLNGNRQNNVQSLVTSSASNLPQVSAKKSIPVSIISKKSNVIIRKDITVIPKKKLRRVLIKEMPVPTTKATNKIIPIQKVSSNNNSSNIQNKNLTNSISYSSDDKKPNLITKSPKSKESSDENLVINLDEEDDVEVKSEKGIDKTKK
jgi:hypothetical protein